MNILRFSKALTIFATILATEQHRSLLFPSRTKLHEQCFITVNQLDIGKFADSFISFEHVAQYCQDMHLSSRVITDITTLHRTVARSMKTEALYHRVLFGLRLLFPANLTMYTTYKGHNYSVALIDHNDAVVSYATVEVETWTAAMSISFESSNEKFILSDIQWHRTLQANGSRLFCLTIHIYVWNSTANRARIIGCDEMRKWDFTFCVSDDSECCYLLKSKTCVADSDAQCFWRYGYLFSSSSLIDEDAVCPKSWLNFSRTPCTCDQCTYTDWIQWTVFTSDSGHTVATRYRPIDINPHWDCAQISTLCCAEFKLVSSTYEYDSLLTDEEVFALIDCQHGSEKNIEMEKCECRNGTSGLWCELNTNECQEDSFFTNCLEVVREGTRCNCKDNGVAMDGSSIERVIQHYPTDVEQRTFEYQARWMLMYLSIALPLVAFIVMSARHLLDTCWHVLLRQNNHRRLPKPKHCNYSITGDKVPISDNNTDDKWDPPHQRDKSENKRAETQQEWSSEGPESKSTTKNVNSLKTVRAMMSNFAKLSRESTESSKRSFPADLLN